MSSDPLRDLLRAADRAAGLPPAVPSDLATRVERLALRRSHPRSGGLAAAAALLLALGLTWQFQATRKSSEPVPSPTVRANRDTPKAGASSDRELARLRSAADMHLAIARRMMARRDYLERLARLKRERVHRQPATIVLVRGELDKAACNIVDYADRLYRELGRVEAAAQSYRRAIQLFPDSTWAQVARTRLMEIETSSGESL